MSEQPKPKPAIGAYDRLTGEELRVGHSYQPPRDWKHGTPFRIDDALVDPRFIDRALALVQRDASTLFEKESIRWKVDLDELCTRVWAACEYPESTLVFFHSDTRSFWAYPGAPSLSDDGES